MAKTLLLKAEIREHTGSKEGRRIRKQGRLPAIMYGHKQEPVAISLDEHNFVEGLHHGHRLMDIQIGKKKEKAIVKDLQYDYLGKNIIHADLMRVDVKESIKVDIPIELKGAAQDTHEGGIVEAHVSHLEIECKVTDIPEVILIPVKEMKVGDVIHAKDIKLPDGVKLVGQPDAIVVTCHVIVAAKTAEEAEEEEPTAPEVIGEVKESEETEEEEK